MYCIVSIKYPRQFTDKRLCQQQWYSSASFQRPLLSRHRLKSSNKLEQIAQSLCSSVFGDYMNCSYPQQIVHYAHSQTTNDSKHFMLTVPRSDDEESWFGVLPEGEILLEPKATPLIVVPARCLCLLVN